MIASPKNQSYPTMLDLIRFSLSVGTINLVLNGITIETYIHHGEENLEIVVNQLIKRMYAIYRVLTMGYSL